jgi:flagella basal body P-ring formation protein FlgA
MSRDRSVALFSVALLLSVLLPWKAVMGAPSTEGQIIEFIKKLYGNSEVQVTFNQLPQGIRERTRIKSISFSKVPDSKGDGICLVGLEGAGGSGTNVYVPFKVQVRTALYSLNRNVKKGETIGLADVSAKETYLQGFTAAYPSGIEEIVGKAAKKEMSAGQMITRQMLEERVMVAKGDMVNLTLENDKLLIQARGVALEKGAIGDSVRVKSASGKEISGRVTGSNSISVQF